VSGAVPYWDCVAWDKTFTLPVDLPLLRAHLPLDSRILDYGCGYGRVVRQLLDAGYASVIGVDLSAEMIRRGRELYPDLNLAVLPAEGWRGAEGWPGHEDAYDAVLLIAVLTCIPSDEDQRALMALLRRLLRPGGLLYLVDYPLQEDERNRQRYARFAPEYGTYGVFRLPEGAVFRHHDLAWVAALLEGFERLHLSYLDVVTMNGHRAQGFQVLGRVVSD
jgi:SAM-dependent methyltransferase